MGQVLIYITTKDKSEALDIGRNIVSKGYAACANVFDNMKSIYKWEDKIEEADEAVLILKTTDNNVNRIITNVKELHSYDCPCILSIPVTNGNIEFLKWVENNSLQNTINKL